MLRCSSRPVFLFGSTPPREGTAPDAVSTTARKFSRRSAVLATDGFIVYDLQEETGRTTMPRPFPFRRTVDCASYAAELARISCKPTVVYKCVVEAELQGFESWLQRSFAFGHRAWIQARE